MIRGIQADSGVVTLVTQHIHANKVLFMHYRVRYEGWAAYTCTKFTPNIHNTPPTSYMAQCTTFYSVATSRNVIYLSFFIRTHILKNDKWYAERYLAYS